MLALPKPILLKGGEPTSLTLTAEAGSGPTAGLTGYVSPFISALGSIDREPFPANLIRLIVEQTATGVISFQLVGNALQVVPGRTLWVDGVPYPNWSGPWVFTPTANTTANSVAAEFAPAFEDEGVYLVEIK